MSQISREEFKKVIEKKDLYQIVSIDVEEHFKTLNFKDSLNVPYNHPQLESLAKEKLSPQKKVVLYSLFQSASLCHEIEDKLIAKGYRTHFYQGSSQDLILEDGIN